MSQENIFFLDIHRLYFISFLCEIYMEKVLQELIWVHFYVCPNYSNGIKIHLDGHCLLYICTWSQLPVVDEA